MKKKYGRRSTTNSQNGCYFVNDVGTDPGIASRGDREEPSSGNVQKRGFFTSANGSNSGSVVGSAALNQ
jgi:hypothetical protein